MPAGAEADVAGEITKAADGRYAIHFRLFDVSRKQVSDESTFTVPAADLRLTAHQIADRIYEKITGEKGAFASRIAFVRQEGRRRYNIMVADSDGEKSAVALTSREPIISIAWYRMEESLLIPLSNPKNRRCLFRIWHQDEGPRLPHIGEITVHRRLARMAGLWQWH